jgi:hypothetical protein
VIIKSYPVSHWMISSPRPPESGEISVYMGAMILFDARDRKRKCYFIRLSAGRVQASCTALCMSVIA